MNILVLILLSLVGCAAGGYTLNDEEQKAIPCIAKMAGDAANPVVDKDYAGMFYNVLAKVGAQETFQPENPDDTLATHRYWVAEKAKYISENTKKGKDYTLIETPQGKDLKIEVQCNQDGAFRKFVITDARADTKLSKLSKSMFNAAGCTGAHAAFQQLFRNNDKLSEIVLGPAPCANKLLMRMCGHKILGWETFIIGIFPFKATCT